MRPLTLVIAAAALVAPVTVAAATNGASGVTSDARCMMTMAALSGAKDENTAHTAQLGVIFFAGRIKAQEPAYDFGVRLKAVAASMNGESLQAEAKRCGPMVVETLRQLNSAQQAFGPPHGAQGQAKPPGAAPPAAAPPAKP